MGNLLSLPSKWRAVLVENSRKVESMRRESTSKKKVFVWGSLFRLYDMLKLFYVSIASKS